MGEQYIFEPQPFREKLYMAENEYAIDSEHGFMDFQGLREKIKDYAWVEILIEEREDRTFLFLIFLKERTPNAMRILINKKGDPTLWMLTQLKRLNLHGRFSGNWCNDKREPLDERGTYEGGSHIFRSTILKKEVVTIKLI